LLKYITPRIRFQEFDFWWETIKLTDLGISVGGTAIESEFDPDGKYKVISIGSYSEESKYKDQGIRAIYSKKTEKRILEKDDLTMILNDKTSTGKIIGRVLLIDEDNSYVYNQRTQRICLDKNKYVPDFIFQLLNADINRNKIVRSAQGNTQIYVNWSDISNLDYLIPDSFDEQSAIGSLFRTLDDLLVSYKDNLTNYQSLKATMLSKMFPKAGQTVPEIRLDGFEGEWKFRKLDEIVNIVGGGTPDTNIKEYWNGEINWFSPTEVGNSIYLDTSEKRISELGLQKSSAKILPANRTILFTSRAGIGSVGIITKDSATNQGFQSLVIKEGIDIYFLFSYSSEITRYAIKHSAGSTFLEISGRELGKMDIIIPSYEEQSAIGSYFSNLDNLIAAHQEKISQLETLKKKLLQDMFI